MSELAHDPFRRFHGIVNRIRVNGVVVAAPSPVPWQSVSYDVIVNMPSGPMWFDGVKPSNRRFDPVAVINPSPIGSDIDAYFVLNELRFNIYEGLSFGEECP